MLFSEKLVFCRLVCQNIGFRKRSLFFFPKVWLLLVYIGRPQQVSIGDLLEGADRCKSSSPISPVWRIALESWARSARGGPRCPTDIEESARRSSSRASERREEVGVDEWNHGS